MRIEFECLKWYIRYMFLYPFFNSSVNTLCTKCNFLMYNNNAYDKFDYIEII